MAIFMERVPLPRDYKATLRRYNTFIRKVPRSTSTYLIDLGRMKFCVDHAATKSFGTSTPGLGIQRPKD